MVELELPDLQDEWTKLQQQEQLEGIDLEQFLTADEELATTGEFSLTDFINQPSTTNSTPSDDEDEIETVEKPPITLAEASKAWEVFQSFMEQNVDYDTMKTVNKVEDKFEELRLHRTKQQKITDFFA